MRVVVAGAGVGGLAAAAALARQGVEVTVLEAQVYPGGCAATYPHQGYRFDSGATLSGGFYPGGPMDRVAQAAGIKDWEGQTTDYVMNVHLPDAPPIAVLSGPDRWEARRRAFGLGADPFFLWQEKTADHLWDLALRLPPWPPRTGADTWRLAKTGFGWIAGDPLERARPRLAADALRSVGFHLPEPLEPGLGRLRQFVDGQLLISAQATSRQVNALYGAAALDLPRRGVVHLKGGMGAIAQKLVEAIHAAGGRVLFRQEVTRIERGSPGFYDIHTRRGEVFQAEGAIVNLPPANILRMVNLKGLYRSARERMRQASAAPADGWGAFMVYAGVDSALIPLDLPLHHQVVCGEPQGEGNSLFLSISPEWDTSRAPAGKRAVTISTHTALARWWQLHEQDPEGYQTRKALYTEKLLTGAEQVLPGLQTALDLVLPGTPVTFQRFTRREQGWVGGYPQTSLWRNWAPELGPGLWMVGDSIFPGQSTAAAALGGLRVAEQVLHKASER